MTFLWLMSVIYLPFEKLPKFCHDKESPDKFNILEFYDPI